MSRGWPSAAQACSSSIAVGRFFRPSSDHAAADRAGTDDEDLVAAAAQFRDLGGELLDLGNIDLAAARSVRMPVPSLTTHRCAAETARFTAG